MELNPVALQFIMHESGATFDNLGLDLAQHAAADVGVFPINQKVHPFEAGVVVTEGLAGGTDTARIKFDRRIHAGSDTGRGDGDIADLNLGVSGVSDVGDVCYDLVAVNSGVTLEPGMEVVVQLISGTSGAGETGHVRPYLLVRRMPETRTNMTRLQATA